MSTSTFKRLSLHLDVVPAYYHRRTGNLIITGIGKTHGGAAVVDPDGEFVHVYPSKSAALIALGRN